MANIAAAVGGGAVVDVVNAVHLIGSSIKQRIDAAKHLPETVSRCVHTIDQIEGAVDGVGNDTATAATMQTIRDLLKALELLIERLESKGATAAGSACGRCFGAWISCTKTGGRETPPAPRRHKSA